MSRRDTVAIETLTAGRRSAMVNVAMAIVRGPGADCGGGCLAGKNGKTSNGTDATGRDQFFKQW